MMVHGQSMLSKSQLGLSEVSWLAGVDTIFEFAWVRPAKRFPIIKSEFRGNASGILLFKFGRLPMAFPRLRSLVREQG